jgi:predicted dehydrogenase
MFEVAIIGAGNIGRIRARVIASCPESRVRVVADVDAARARDLAQSVGAEATTDWRAAVRAPEVDLVVVSTPTKFHAQAAISALAAGKHVLCEKPLARSVAEAEEMVAEAEARERVLKTGFNYRYMAHVRKARQLIETGALGPLHFLRCRYGHGGRPGYEKHWCTDRELSGGGVLLEQGIHILDLVRYLLDEPAQVLAQSSRFFWDFPEVEDNCFLLLQTRSGQSAQIHVSWTQWTNIFSLEIFGRDGHLHLSGREGHYGPQRLLWAKRRPDHSRPQEEAFEFPPPDNSWEREWKDFLAAVRHHREPMGNPRDSLRALELVEAAYQSSRQQTWVDVAPAIELVESETVESKA